MVEKERKNREVDKALKELRQIKNLLILSLLKGGATSEEVNFATGMGAANIRGMFPLKRGKEKSQATE